jgi:hypothetical protein
MSSDPPPPAPPSGGAGTSGAAPPPEPPSGPPPEGPESRRPPEQFPSTEVSAPPAVPADTTRFSDYRRGNRFPLRQMDVGQILDAGINLYRAHWKTLMGIAALILVPVNFFQSFIVRRVTQPFASFSGRPFPTFTPPTQDPFTTPGQSPELPDFGPLITAVFSATLITVAIGLISSALLTAAISRATAETYQGRDPEVGPTLSFAAYRLHSILWVIVLTGLSVLGGVLLCLIPGIIFAVRFLFSPAVLVVEGTKGTDALRRSWRLSADHFWKVLGVFILGGILSFIIGGVFQLPFGVIASTMDSGGWIVEATGNSIGQVLAAPFATIIQVLLYFDMRIRKEGFDLAVMAEELAAGG